MQDKKQKLLSVLANKIKHYRGQNSITKLSYEVDISKSIWSLVEKGERDVQFTTLYRMAEALNIKLSDLITEVEHELGNNFSFIEDDIEREELRLVKN